MLDLLLSDSSLPGDVEVSKSVNNFVDRCLRFYYLNGETTNITLNPDELIQSVESAFCFVSHVKGLNGFKVSAAFILSLASKKPFKTPLSRDYDPVQSDQNIVLGILESLYWLHGIEMATAEGAKKVISPIHFTDHYFVELIQTISRASQNFQGNFDDESNDRAKVFLTALILESAAYKSNDHIPYKKNPLTKKASSYFENFP